MELDNRVGDYAAAIVRDVDLLLANSVGMDDKQRDSAASLKRNADKFLSLYTQHAADFIDLTHESQVYAHDMRSPLGNISGFSNWLLEYYPLATPLERQLLEHIKSSYDVIDASLVAWATQYMHPLDETDGT